MITGGGVGGFWICGSGALMVDGIGVFGQGMAVGVIHSFFINICGTRVYNDGGAWGGKGKEDVYTPLARPTQKHPETIGRQRREREKDHD